MMPAIENRFSPDESKRIFRAFALGCIAPILPLIAVFLVSQDKPITKDTTGAILTLLPIVILVSGAGVLFVGIFLHAFLVSRQLTGYRWYAIAGIASGIALSVVMAIAKANDDVVRSFLVNSAIMCPLCATSSLAFRFGWRAPKA
jgi:hypothetical protein